MQFIQTPQIQYRNLSFHLTPYFLLYHDLKNPVLPDLLCHAICTKYGNWYTNTATNNKYTK